MAEELCPTCNTEIGFWTDDPILTPLGLSGEDYIGITFPNISHIIELRAYYNDIEVKSGMNVTVWSDELENDLNLPKRIHIEEIRLVIENILSNQSSSLSEYFSEASRSNTDWTDVDRDNEGTLPSLPDNTIIKAIHIEELRIGSYLDPNPEEQTRILWQELFGGSYSDSGSFSYTKPYGYVSDPNFELGRFAGSNSWSNRTTGYSYLGGNAYGDGSSSWAYTQNSIEFNTSGGDTVGCYMYNIRSTGASSTLFPATSKILIKDLSFSGSNCQSIMKVNLSIDVYKMDTEWVSSKDRTVYVPLWFYSQNGEVKRPGTSAGRVWYVSSGVLTFESSMTAIPLASHWREMTDIHMGIIDAMKLYSDEHPEVNLPLSDEGLNVGDEYIQRINFHGVWVDNLTSSKESSSNLKFSIGEITFYVEE